MNFSKRIPVLISQFVLIILLFFFSCSEEIIENEILVNQNIDTDDIAVSLEGNLQISDFVWKGLNEFYYWQEEVDELSDEKLEDEKAYGLYISENSDPEIFFESLKHPDDRFSWIQDDYQELENTLQGIIATNGVEFGLLYACENCNELVGFVKYILEDSNATGKNIKRGDYFTAVNGTPLTVSNYRSLLYGKNLSYTLNMASVQNGSLYSNGINVELVKEENFEVNPIQIQKTIPLGSKNSNNGGIIGYLMYNQFVADKSVFLNQAFADFKTQGITDLILGVLFGERFEITYKITGSCNIFFSLFIKTSNNCIIRPLE